ncbi:LPS export ABC transporter periplasmic protein LptC [Denitrificimonas sp. JX-1]|uniref:Lipopolysaccharide export system protein LptC n=1 Tax=Denitrificimonas halotolerans TaxID=3098930 RepID=A0ABU5GMT0_9GAMM|nr:LPS export ABC transporter periplasmic protein LptC [Denitrificimonas sp. JX-1]MDY7218257.1 LPS export ABC transporter periplasmic protein LptC [Denitrificimonas sp. JX-1]
MSANARLALFFLPFALMVAALGYWNINNPEEIEPTTLVTDKNDIDFFAQGTHTIQFDETGALNYELTSPSIEHTQNDDITVLLEPELLLYRGSDLPWNISSKRSLVSPEGTEVELIDNVRIARTDEKGRPVILSTEQLTYVPETEYAHTKLAVKIEAANGITTGVGMQTYLNESKMHLLSNVRGRHEVR